MRLSLKDLRKYNGHGVQPAGTVASGGQVWDPFLATKIEKKAESLICIPKINTNSIVYYTINCNSNWAGNFDMIPNFIVGAFVFPKMTLDTD